MTSPQGLVLHWWWFELSFNLWGQFSFGIHGTFGLMVLHYVTLPVSLKNDPVVPLLWHCNCLCCSVVLRDLLVSEFFSTLKFIQQKSNSCFASCSSVMTLLSVIDGSPTRRRVVWLRVKSCPEMCWRDGTTAEMPPAISRHNYNNLSSARSSNRKQVPHRKQVKRFPSLYNGVSEMQTPNVCGVV